MSGWAVATPRFWDGVVKYYILGYNVQEYAIKKKQNNLCIM